MAETRTADTEDEIWLLQHPPVFTQGQAGRDEPRPEDRRERGEELLLGRGERARRGRNRPVYVTGFGEHIKHKTP